MKLDLAAFRALRAEMNAHPERFAEVGDATFVAGFALRQPASAVVCFMASFDGLSCTEVSEVDFHELQDGDFWLDGPTAAWEAMFADIVAHGGAEGGQTINSLALLGDRIALRGRDPMGLDKFSRFNQTLQSFLDGAARTNAAPLPRTGALR